MAPMFPPGNEMIHHFPPMFFNYQKNIPWCILGTFSLSRTQKTQPHLCRGADMPKQVGWEDLVDH